MMALGYGSARTVGNSSTTRLAHAMARHVAKGHRLPST
jgi:hypothetical protein